jgi:hypothetical protein
MALNFTGWHCDADIISSVSALSLGEHHVDLNTDGKRASIVGLASMEGCMDIHLTYRPVDDAGRQDIGVEVPRAEDGRAP